MTNEYAQAVSMSDMIQASETLDKLTRAIVIGNGIEAEQARILLDVLVSHTRLKMIVVEE